VNRPTCLTCRDYDARSRWCNGAEQVVTNLTAGACHFYDGPHEDDCECTDCEEARDEAAADFALNVQRESEV
jgi:hypothetical protein